MSVTYQILEYPPEAAEGYMAHGQAHDFYYCKDPEAVISGPSETGKTRVALEKLDALMWLFPGAQAAIIRKTRTSMTGSVLQTFEKKVLPPNTPVKAYGGNDVRWYDYPTGSRIFVGGLDNPDKVFSSERDVIYVNQAEELELDDWEKLCTRVTGRAGNMPYAQVFADCNPSYPAHWIQERKNGGRLRYFESRHEDNPTLFDPRTGQITEQGRRTMDVLDNLTGLRKKRLRYGIWAAAEGMVYEEWDPALHVIDRFPIPAEWARYRSIDFGYRNPFVCQWWAQDNDGALYRYRELYVTGRLVSDLARQINELSAGERYVATLADHDAEDRATLHAGGVYTQPAPKEVMPGIEAVQGRLRRGDNGKARIYFLRDSLVARDPVLVEARKPTCTEEEPEGYVWEKGIDGRPAKEQPHKEDDHGLDCARYLCKYLTSSSQGVYL